MKYLENFFKSMVGSHIKSFDVIIGETIHTVMFKSDVSFALLSQYGAFGSAFVDTSWGERIIFSRASNMRTIDNPLL